MAQGNGARHLITPARCPLCGQENYCARAADPEAGACWCFTEHVPAELRASVPDELRDCICVCQRCIARHRGELHTIDKAGIAALFERIRRDR